MIMKKILLGLIMLATAATMSAQIELELIIENAFLRTDYTFYGPQQAGVDCLILHEYKEAEAEVGPMTWRLFDESMQLIVEIPYIEYDEYLRLVTRNIFTTDNRLCYATIKDKAGLVIYDETREVLYTIPNVDADYPIFLKKINNRYKLIVAVYDRSTKNLNTHIYSCPGNGEVTTSVEDVPAKVKRNAYPNPATEIVTLPYDANGATSMKIYDMQGKLVERKFLDKNKQELQLNVKNYPSGMYFFEVNGESNSFIVD
jgi:hypothetical protein